MVTDDINTRIRVSSGKKYDSRDSLLVSRDTGETDCEKTTSQGYLPD